MTDVVAAAKAEETARRGSPKDTFFSTAVLPGNTQSTETLAILGFQDETTETVLGGRCPKGPHRSLPMSDPLEIVDTLLLSYTDEVSRDDLSVPIGLTAGRIAGACGVPRTRMERIADERLGITGDTAVPRRTVLDTGSEVWTDQTRFETETARAAVGEAVDTRQELNRAS